MAGARAVEDALPSFSKPPVVEVVVGVEFVPHPGLTAVKLARLYERWREDFPRIQELPAIPPNPAPGVGQGFEISFGMAPGLLRLWMLTEDGQMLVQIQHDRLMLNWRRMSENQHYPRYLELRKKFEKLWADFQSFLDEEGMPPIGPAFVEVTFINAIAIHHGSAIEDVINLLNPPSAQLPGSAVLTRFQAVREVAVPSGAKGHLTIAAEPGPDEGSLALNLTTRLGVTDEAQGMTMLPLLDAAHACGVVGFAAVTTNKMHNIWRRYV